MSVTLLNINMPTIEENSVTIVYLLTEINLISMKSR